MNRPGLQYSPYVSSVPVPASPTLLIGSPAGPRCLLFGAIRTSPGFFRLLAMAVAAFSLAVAPARAAQTAPPPNPLGLWQSVDFVREVDAFQPGTRQWKGDLFLKEFQFQAGGRTSSRRTWEGGWLLHENGRTRAQYFIKTLDGADYLFLPWLSGDVTERGAEPSYYVLKRFEAAQDGELPIKPFDDARWKDLSGLGFSLHPGLPATLTFNGQTTWPDAQKMPAGCDPRTLLRDAMNPGLGIRALHQQGITGKGVNVAIIDQPLYRDHPEFAGKIAAYHDTGCGSESSMHGPAVASLLVGDHCGTAPEATLYYAAAPSWAGDAAYYAAAVDWILEQNAQLPEGNKIRAISVSAAPSGQGSPFEENLAMWDDAWRRAEAAGILVLDCTGHHGFIGRCYLDTAAPDDVTHCKAGSPARPATSIPERLLAPSSPRTTAEQREQDSPSYQYCGQGGLSWSIPYCTGVLAMGWQLRPDQTAPELRELLFNSAYVDVHGSRFIDPGKFINAVRALPVE